VLQDCADQVIKDDCRLTVGRDSRVDLRPCLFIGLGVTHRQPVDVRVTEVIPPPEQLLRVPRGDRHVHRLRGIVRSPPPDGIEDRERVPVDLRERELGLRPELEDLLEEVVVGFEDDQRLLSRAPTAVITDASWW
jgi:hypothetical protein